VTARRRNVELSVERPLAPRGPTGAVARLSARFEVSGEAERPSVAELSQALDELVRDLEAVLGPSTATGSAGRGDRTVDELVEAYRPRQRELVDLLLEDGEITPGEHAGLVAHLGSRPAAVPAATPPPSSELGRVGETPIAAVPLSTEPRLPPARPVPELLRTFQIASLRQAGAVRARRQISFAEYMALKRHFESTGEAGRPNRPADGQA
jgi:hypothetical protein